MFHIITDTDIMDNNQKPTYIQLLLAVAITIFGCALIASSFWVDPHGEIHPTVLAAFGEILTFAGTVMGIDYKYKNK